MEEEIYLIDDHRLARLNKYLNYQISTLILLIAAFFVFPILYAALPVAVVFSAYMLTVLWKEHKKGWVVFFAIMVGLPFILALILVIFYTYTTFILLASIPLFYFYFFLLRYESNDWVKELRARNQYLIEKKKREEEMNSFMGNIE